MKLSKKLFILATSFFVMANGFFVSCSDDAGDDTAPVTKPTTPPSPPVSGGGNNSQPEPIKDDSFKLSDLDNYYKNYFVKAGTDGHTIADWGAGSQATQKEDKTWSIKASDSMWEGIGGIAAPFTQLEEGFLAGYEYLVFTADFSNYTINTAKATDNYGVNIKIPAVQKAITNNFVTNADGTRTYYAKISDFAPAPQTATEFALIIGGSGTFELKELYLAAAENPAEKAVTGITISPESASLMQGEKLEFTVKDSNLKNVTNDATYELSGEAETGATIENGLLTAGTKAGALTVKATYTVDGKTFESTANVTVLGAMENLLTKLSHRGNSQVEVTDNEDGSFSITSNGAGGDWESQAFFTVDESCLKKLTDGKKVKINVTIETETNVKAFMKLQVNNEYAGIDNNSSIPELKAGDTKDISITGELAGVKSDELVLLFAFRGTESNKTIKLSNFQIYDITN